MKFVKNVPFFFGIYTKIVMIQKVYHEMIRLITLFIFSKIKAGVPWFQQNFIEAQLAAGKDICFCFDAQINYHWESRVTMDECFVLPSSLEHFTDLSLFSVHCPSYE